MKSISVLNPLQIRSKNEKFLLFLHMTSSANEKHLGRKIIWGKIMMISDFLLVEHFSFGSFDQPSYTYK
jgi:hypothetical protein